MAPEPITVSLFRKKAMARCFNDVLSCNIYTDQVSYYCSVNKAFQYKQSDIFQSRMLSYNEKLSITMGKKEWTEQMLFRFQLDIQMNIANT